jgi:hypothetical protein
VHNLHIISTPVENLVLHEIMQEAIGGHDTVILCGEAVFSNPTRLEELSTRCTLVALSDELSEYHRNTTPEINAISFSQWAELIASAQVVNHWV